MNNANQFDPVYDDRVNFVMKEMENGKSREQIVEMLGLANWKSIDMHMRRRNFVYDKTTEKYIPKVVPEEVKPIVSIPTKITRILSRFEQLGKEANPQSIANEYGFANAKEMAKYLSDNGYYWSTEKFAYISSRSLITDENVNSTHGEVIERLSDSENLARGVTFSDSLGESMAIEKYLPLLEFLQRNISVLQDLLLQPSQGNIPKYAVPGTAKTKSIYMSDLVSMLINEFCQDKNLSQREVAEAAFIEYMKKYGYEREVGLLLQKR